MAMRYASKTDAASGRNSSSLVARLDGFIPLTFVDY